MGDDPRIVAGARCSWWDSIDNVKVTAGGMPVCPHCGSPLFEWADEDAWWDGVRKREGVAENYETFCRWVRGKCFRTYDDAMFAWITSETAT